MWTPWGPSQWQETIAEGITAVSTAGHGGIKLSPKRQQELQQKFPHFQTFTSRVETREQCWYEEDSDVCVVFLAFPNCFKDTAIRGAIQTAHAMATWDGCESNWLPISQWLVTPEAAELNIRMDKINAENANKWEAGSMGSCKEGWDVSFTRVRDKENKYVKLARYPSKQFYSDAELEEVAV